MQYPKNNDYGFSYSKEEGEAIIIWLLSRYALNNGLIQSLDEIKQRLG